MNRSKNATELECLKNEKISGITGAHEGSECVVFLLESGKSVMFEHIQDCCESVSLESIDGSVSAAIGETILSAHEVVDKYGQPAPEYSESWTKTWYTIRTQSTTLVFRWHGSSNGYYSERVEVHVAPAPKPAKKQPVHVVYAPTNGHEELRWEVQEPDGYIVAFCETEAEADEVVLALNALRGFDDD